MTARQNDKTSDTIFPRRFGLAVWETRLHGIKDLNQVRRYAASMARDGYDLIIPGGAPDQERVFIEVCHAHGVKVHHWVVVFNEGAHSELLRRHPEYAAKWPPKERWSCACRPEVQAFKLDQYMRLLRASRPDGLHLDYIRAGFICRCDYCKAQMRRRGVDIERVEPRDPAYDKWIRWRTARVTDFVRRIRQATTAAGFELSAAVFSGYPNCIAYEAQDWVQWAEEGLVDYLFPMNYTNSTREAATSAITHVALVRGRVPVWEGLGKLSSRSQLSTPALLAQVRSALDADADGIVLFRDSAVTRADLQGIQRLRK